MKKQFMLFAFMLLAAFSSFAQGDYFNYYTVDVINLKQYDIANQKIATSGIIDLIAYDGLMFYTVGPEKEDAAYGKYHVVRFYHLKKKKVENPRAINSTNSDDDDNNWFCIKSEDLLNTKCVVKRYKLGQPRLVVGQLTIPFKIRPKVGNAPANFTGDFTVGASVGIGFRINRYRDYYLNLSAAGGLTNVSVDSATTDGYVKETTNWSALSGGAALTVDFDGFQVGIVAGCDFIGGNQGTKWVYNNNLWYSVGIGYQFLKPKDKEGKKQD